MRGRLAQLRRETRPTQRRAKATAFDEAAVTVQAQVDQKRYGAAWRAVGEITGDDGPPKKRARVIKRPDGTEPTDPRAQVEAFADAAKAHFNRDEHVAPEVLAGLNTEPNLEPSGLPSPPDDVLPFLKRAANGRAADANGITKELIVAAGRTSRARSRRRCSSSSPARRSRPRCARSCTRSTRRATRS